MNVETIEKCVKLIPNKFELILLLNQRISEINSGAISKLENLDNRKNIITAINEVAQQVVDVDELRYRKIVRLSGKSSRLSEKNTENVDLEEDLLIINQLDSISEEDYDKVNDDLDMFANKDEEE